MYENLLAYTQLFGRYSEFRIAMDVNWGSGRGFCEIYPDNMVWMSDEFSRRHVYYGNPYLMDPIHPVEYALLQASCASEKK